MSQFTEVTIGDCRLILGDCRDVLPTLGKFDAVITDPPYGIGFEYESYVDTQESLIELVNVLDLTDREKYTRAVSLCGITQINLYPKPEWIACITWNTTGQFGMLGYTQWMPVLFYGKDLTGFGNINGNTKSDVLRISGGGGVGFARKETIDHPCPKPLNIMNWCVTRFSNKDETVLDPFMGSGTTGVACANMGRKFTGIEREPKYFDIACERIENAYRQTRMFA